MFRLIRLFRTSIGSKLVMAVSGLLLVIFLLGHMLGNMKVFQGQQALNDYAAWLQGHPLLWVFRIAMLTFFGGHVVTGARLALENRAGRPRRYECNTTVQVGIAPRIMIWTGLLVLAFLIYHLLHLTAGVVDPAHSTLMDASGRPDVYARVVESFRQPWIAGTYVAALLLLGFHLNHAILSLLQTLGFNHESYQTFIRVFAPTLTVLLVAGFISVPLSVLLGVVGLPAGASP